jgi:hypothetical protein
MNKHLIRVDGDDFGGRCCSRCTWGMTTPLDFHGKRYQWNQSE